HPPSQHARDQGGGGDRAIPRAGFLPRLRDRRRPRELHRGARAGSARVGHRGLETVGPMSTDYQSGQLAPDAVRRMFDRIAPVYDAMNRTMTAGLDRRWRRLTAEAVVRPGDRVLDACCGTGDLALAAERAGGRVTGVDFSERMLDRARRKSHTIEWASGDLLDPPFRSAA